MPEASSRRARSRAHRQPARTAGEQRVGKAMGVAFGSTCWLSFALVFARTFGVSAIPAAVVLAPVAMLILVCICEATYTVRRRWREPEPRASASA